MTNTDAAARDAAFFDYYHAEIAPELAQLEGRRKQMAMAVKALWGLCVLGFALFMLSGVIGPALGLSDQAIVVVAFVCVFGGAGGAIVLRRVASTPFKRALVGRTCEFLGFDYSSRGEHFPFDLVHDADVTETFETGKVRDRIKGRHKGVDIDVAEALLRTTRKRSNSSETFDSFRGLLLVFTFPRPFKGHTVLRPDATLIGNALVGTRRTGERISLEDPRFESQFEVYGDDPVSARSLLTPRFMEQVVELSRSLDTDPGGKGHLALSFLGKNLVVAIRSKNKFFEGGSVLKRADDSARAEELMSELRMIYAIVDILELSANDAPTPSSASSS